MRKVIFFILLISLFPINIFAINNSNFADVTKDASSAVMIEATTGQVLYNKNANNPQSVASLTKMMGLILIFDAIEKGAIKKDEVLTVSENAKNMGGTQIWLETGEKITVNDLIKGITMASANDAMIAMAERVAGTEEAFVKMMNDKVKEFGLKNTYFKNSTGLSEKGQYSSAYDMAIIAKHLISYDLALKYTKEYESYIREKTANKTWITNTNKLVKFYEGTDGLKTGFEDDAGSCMAVTTKRSNLRLIAITLGFSDSKIRNQQTMDLLDYGFNQYEAKIIYKKGTVMGKINLEKANRDSINLVLKNDVVGVNKKSNNEDKYTYDIDLNDIVYPIKRNDEIGLLKVKNNGKVISSFSLVAGDDANKAGIVNLYFKNLKDVILGI